MFSGFRENSRYRGNHYCTGVTGLSIEMETNPIKS